MLFYAVKAFQLADPETRLVVVIPKTHAHLWTPIQQTYFSGVDIFVTYGGETRFHSVSNGLNAMNETDVVAIHDAARPLISPQLINRLFDAAIKNGTAIPVVRVPESIRQVLPERHQALSRDQFVLVQTPQIFHWDILRTAYQQPYQPSFTDDATVVEAAGFPIHLIDGEPINQKITTPNDLVAAEAHLRRLR